MTSFTITNVPNPLFAKGFPVSMFVKRIKCVCGSANVEQAFQHDNTGEVIGKSYHCIDCHARA